MSEANVAPIEIVIDGKKVVCKPGESLIQVADREGIYIPRFCYHDRLSVVANCRMCLVDVHKAPKPMPACATPVADGMEISTKSKRALEAQRSVMEFLLINHPLDCPICDQGGECELQDAAMGFGRGVSRYDQSKRAVEDEDLGPLIATHMTRCIHCTRCVRFGEEIAGMPEIGGLNRGENTKIGTYLQSGVHSELSGNMIDVCPVGALTAKPSEFKGRSWSFQQHASIGAHDGVGSHTYIHTIVANTHEVPKVMRVVPKACEAVNDVWISNVDRFAYSGLDHHDRLEKPLVKRDGKWIEVDWVEALEEVTARWQGVLSHHGRESAAGLISPNATVEELYLFQKWLRSMGVNHIDHRLRHAEMDKEVLFPQGPTLGLPLSAIESQSVIILFGDDVRRTQPMLNHRIREAQKAGTVVFAVGAYDPAYNFDVEGCWLRPDLWPVLLHALKTGKVPSALGALAKAFVERVHQAMGSDKATWLLLGQDVMNHPQASLLQTEALSWGERDEWLSIGHLTPGSNAVGAWQMGAIPHQGPFGAQLSTPGLGATACVQAPRKAYWLHGIEPAYDASCGLEKALMEAECVVACSAFDAPSLRKHADVLLPIAPYSECSGSRVNMEGRWQSYQAALPPRGESRPAWKVYRVLANLAHCEGFDYNDLADVQAEIDQLRENTQSEVVAYPAPSIDTQKADGLCLFSAYPLERACAVVRRSEPLQAAFNQTPCLRINAKTAKAQGWKEGQTYRVRSDKGSVYSLPLSIDERVADGVLYYLSGLDEAPVFEHNALSVALEEMA